MRKVLVCYLDDSGEAKEPVITMAGLLGSADRWLDFERQARTFFDEVRLRYLHTVDLHHRRGEFEAWSSAETAEFAHALFRIVERYALFAVEFSVLKSRFNERKIRYGLRRETSAFSMCFRGVLDRIVKDEDFQEAEEAPEANLSFVVESGNKNNQDVLQRFKAIKRMDPNRFGSPVFEDKRKCIALQAADFIAFYSRRIRNRASENSRVAELDLLRRTLGDMKHKPFFATDFYA
jgi:Protein of unknown function (DUF3800)